MRNIKRNAFIGVCVTLCLAISWRVLSERPRLSRDDAIRIADAKISHDLPGAPSSYHRIAVSYFREELVWVVAYQVTESGSRCVVQVEDRTGESIIMMPKKAEADQAFRLSLTSSVDKEGGVPRQTEDR